MSHSLPISSNTDAPEVSRDWACLDWPLLLEALRQRTQTRYGRVRIETDALWLDTPSDVQMALDLVSELKQLIQRYGAETLQELPNCLPTLQRLSKGGRFYSVSELAEFTFCLSEMSRLFRFVIQNRSVQETPCWVAFLETVTLPNDVLESLTRVIEPQLGATLKDSASPRYGELSHRVHEQRQHIERRLQGLLSKLAPMLQESLVTQREGRYVLPVKAGLQSQVEGSVVDSSLSGDTVFIEPKAISADCATLRRLQKELDAEIERLLDVLSAAVLPSCDALFSFLEAFSALDVLWAKAVLSLDLDAMAPERVSEPGVIRLKRARHPLLVLQSPQSDVVANDVIFSETTRCVIVSGPNTGGKTVTLKLLGLFALMLHCGIHVPVAEGSQMSLFSPIFADSGDSQSVVQNLSTFSAHLRRLKAILDEPDLSQALILIDEIGAGTDPAEATALAESVLKHLVHQRQSTVMVTTHLSSLKRLAYEESGFENASVEFNTETLQPTYRLILNSAGQSHALDIAKTLGLSEELITHAKRLYAAKQTTSDDLITELETRQAKAAIYLREAEDLKAKVEKEHRELQDKLNRLDGEKRQLLETYRTQLAGQFRHVEQRLETAKDVLKRKKQRPSDVRFAGKSLKQARETGHDITEKSISELYQTVTIPWETIAIGDLVTSKTFNLKGEVIERHDKQKEVTIQSGMLKTVVPLGDIIRVDAKTGHNKASLPGASGRGASSKSPAPKGPRIALRECDIRGLMGDDGLGVLEKFLDDALMDNISTVAVIHGRGTGALKNRIRDALAVMPFVETFYPAEAIDGGDGKTIIELR